MTDAGEEFYRHAVVILCDAELTDSAIRHRLTEPTGAVPCTVAMATIQFAIRDTLGYFLVRYPKVNVVAHAIDRVKSERRVPFKETGTSPSYSELEG